jgi:hypothetical protein
MLPSSPATALGLKNWPRALRQRVWYGGSICSGYSFIPPSPSLPCAGSKPRVEVNVLKSTAQRLKSSARDTTQ